jgi:hypothetical protein
MTAPRGTVTCSLGNRPILPKPDPVSRIKKREAPVLRSRGPGGQALRLRIAVVSASALEDPWSFGPGVHES